MRVGRLARAGRKATSGSPRKRVIGRSRAWCMSRTAKATPRVDAANSCPGSSSGLLIRSQHDRKLPATIRFTQPARTGAAGSRGAAGGVCPPHRTGGWGRPSDRRRGAGVVAPDGVKLIEWRLLGDRAGIDSASSAQVIDGYRYAGRSDCCFASSRTPRASKPCDRWNDCNGPLRSTWCGLTHRTADALGTTLPGLAGRAVRRAGGMEKGGCLAEEASAQAAAHAQSGDPAIATLGGFLDRKGDGEPGVKTLRLGYSASPTSASGCGMPESRGWFESWASGWSRR